MLFHCMAKTTWFDGTIFHGIIMNSVYIQNCLMSTIQSISQIKLHTVRILLAYMSFTQLTMLFFLWIFFQTDASFSFLPLLHTPYQQILP